MLLFNSSVLGNVFCDCCKNRSTGFLASGSTLYIEDYGFTSLVDLVCIVSSIFMILTFLFYVSYV